jgi:hypothetical protein
MIDILYDPGYSIYRFVKGGQFSETATRQRKHRDQITKEPHADFHSEATLVEGFGKVPVRFPFTESIHRLQLCQTWGKLNRSGAADGVSLNRHVPEKRSK